MEIVFVGLRNAAPSASLNARILAALEAAPQDATAASYVGRQVASQMRSSPSRLIACGIAVAAMLALAIFLPSYRHSAMPPRAAAHTALTPSVNETATVAERSVYPTAQALPAGRSSIQPHTPLPAVQAVAHHASRRAMLLPVTARPARSGRSFSRTANLDALAVAELHEPSRFAPPEPLTRQEKLLQQLALAPPAPANPPDLLDPAARARHNDEVLASLSRSPD